MRKNYRPVVPGRALLAKFLEILYVHSLLH